MSGRCLYSFSLVFWLVFSTATHAVTFVFKTTGGDTDIAFFEATIVSTDDTLPIVRIETSVGDLVRFRTERLATLSIFFRFPGGESRIIVTPFAAEIGESGFDFFEFDPRSIFYATGLGFNDIGIDGNESGGIWTIDLLAEDPIFNANLSGVFVQVSEPAPGVLLGLGLAVIGIRLRRRSA